MTDSSTPIITSSSSKRFKIIDYGRGLAVLLMVFLHTLWMYADKTVQNDSTLWSVVHFIRKGKGTAAFLILMGISMVLSKNQSLKGDYFRGLLILVFAYLMNWQGKLQIQSQGLESSGKIIV